MTDAPQPTSFEQLFLSEYEPMLRMAYLITGDSGSAEDVVQDAFADLFARWGRIQHYDRPGAWVRRVVTQRAVRSRKRAARSERTDSANRCHHVTFDHDIHRDLLDALTELTKKQRAAVVLHYFCDLPVTEVAKLLRCRPSTASVHLHRARNKLRDLVPAP